MQCGTLGGVQFWELSGTVAHNRRGGQEDHANGAPRSAVQYAGIITLFLSDL
jgi:hypothetical protein